MWTIATVILFASGIFGEDICENNPYNMCDYPSSGVPGNAQELNELCPVILNYYDCLEDYEKTCQDKPGVFNVYISGQYASVRSLIVDVCTEGTSLHSAVFENINCIKDRFRNRSVECHEDSHQVSNAYKELQNETENQEEAHFTHLSEMCMYFFYDLGCFITSIANKCGASLKDAMVEIVNQSYFLRTQCNIDIVRELRTLVENLNIDDSQKDALQESFRMLAWEE